MKRQRKYTTREMILKDIDRAQAKLEKTRLTASEFEAQAEFCRVAEDKTNFDRCKSEAETLWKKAERLKNTRLKRLSLTLSAFDTKPLIGDEQVVLQRVA